MSKSPFCELQVDNDVCEVPEGEIRDRAYYIIADEEAAMTDKWDQYNKIEPEVYFMAGSL